ncbi:MAG: NAD(P)H-hydrate dehydratase [Pseudomonadales bacterium]
MHSRRGANRMIQLYSAEQCRTLDRLALDSLEISGFELMQRAGRAAFNELIHRWPQARTLTVYCGKGNNAGDGYIIAGLARALGLEVDVLETGAGALKGDALLARNWVLERDVHPRDVSLIGELPPADVVVDALLGTGLTGALRPPFAALVARINTSGRPVLAVDIPSGVNADTGAVVDAAVRADVTVTFIGRKIGLTTGAGLEHAGEVVFADLGVDAASRRQLQGVNWLTLSALLEWRPLPVRTAAAYKQALGHVVVVGGDRSMGGAPLMAAEAALRSGAGMVTVVTRGAHRNAILSRRPELMVVDADSETERAEAFSRASLFVLGPGLGRDDWGHRLLQAVLDTGKRVVIDADGLNGLVELGATPAAPCVITPHVGEAARLLGESSAGIQADRPGAACRLARRVGGIAVLKGAGTVVAGCPDASPEQAGSAAVLGICAHGNPGMATAGMGDVLAGIIGGLWAQGADEQTAALTGVCLHSRAADLAVKQVGERSLLATDLLPHLMTLLR